MKCFILNYCGIPFGMCILTYVLEVCTFPVSLFQSLAKFWLCMGLELIHTANILKCPKKVCDGSFKEKLRQPGPTWSCQLIKMITLQKCNRLFMPFNETNRPAGSLQQHITSQFIIFCPRYHSFCLFLVVLSLLGSQTGLRSSVASLLSCFITINNLIPTKNGIYLFYWEKTNKCENMIGIHKNSTIS